MDVTAGEAAVTMVCALAFIVGVLGVVIPGVPALVVGWFGVLLWTVVADRGIGKWLLLAAVTLIAVLGFLAKYALPGRKLKRVGVPNLSLVVGTLFGLVGFFVIPIIGVLLGFVLGTWLAEMIRLRSLSRSWPSTWHALRAAGLSMVIELGAILLMAVVWFAGAILV